METDRYIHEFSPSLKRNGKKKKIVPKVLKHCLLIKLDTANADRTNNQPVESAKFQDVQEFPEESFYHCGPESRYNFGRHKAIWKI